MSEREMTRREVMKKERKARRKRFNQALKHVTPIEPYAYYYSDKHKRLKEVQPEEVKLNGVTYEKTNELYNVALNDIEQFKINYKGVSSLLTAFLIDNGYNTPNIELNALVDDLKHLLVIKPDVEYTGYKLDGKFIVGRGYDLIRQVDENEPEDYDGGYWYIDNDEWKIDSERYHQVWGV